MSWSFLCSAEYQKHSKPDSFKDDDDALFGKIGNLNDEIDSIN
jgi:hypothetical protein